MNILKQKDNKLLKREEIIAEVTENSIPSKVNIAKKIGEKLKKPEENVVIEKISTQFGNHTFKIFAKVYDSKESKEKYESISRKERKKILEEKKKAEEEAKKAKGDSA